MTEVYGRAVTSSRGFLARRHIYIYINIHTVPEKEHLLKVNQITSQVQTKPQKVFQIAPGLTNAPSAMRCYAIAMRQGPFQTPIILGKSWGGAHHPFEGSLLAASW